MLSRLLRKEIRLSMHPTAVVMLALSAMVLIPNYPYTVIFFYTTLSLFFTCLQGRENNDVVYSLTLPTAKRDIVRGRFAFAALLELAQLLLTGLFCLLKQRLALPANQAGLQAGPVLIAAGFALFGVFNAVFFPAYYRNVVKIGVPFVAATTVFFALVAAGEVVIHAVPFARDCLNTSDPAVLPVQLLSLAVGFAVWLLLTAAAYRVSVRRFERLDL